MRYRLIAIDLDGTLLCPEGRVSRENRDALHAAHEAGAMVLPCTGRGWRESREAIVSVPASELGVFNTGALVCGLMDGGTRDRAVFDAETAAELIALVGEAGDAVLLYTDPAETGYEYVVTGRGGLTPNTKWWFERNGLRWAQQPEVDAALLGHVVRVGALASPARAERVVRATRERMPGRVEAHAFEAVQEPGDAGPIHIIECFARGVSKWRGIEWVAQRHGIAAQQVAVIGDQINDVPMFRRAGCAVAMENAIPAIKQAAHYHTLCNQRHGVAHAIGKMLAGVW